MQHEIHIIYIDIDFVWLHRDEAGLIDAYGERVTWTLGHRFCPVDDRSARGGWKESGRGDNRLSADDAGNDGQKRDRYSGASHG